MTDLRARPRVLTGYNRRPSKGSRVGRLPGVRDRDPLTGVREAR